jgi:hypothetical protein
MNDNRTLPPPLPPVPLPPIPVLSYQVDALTTPFWLARLICGLAITYGTVSVAYIAGSHIPSVNPSPHPWSDLPVVVAGLVLMIFGWLGVFRVSGSRQGISISAVLSLLCSWTGQWVSLRMYGPPDASAIASFFVGLVDNAAVPVFVVICLNREPIKGYFTSRPM